MQRLGTLFIAVCMVIVSGSAGALLYLLAGVSVAISGLAALTLLLALAWWQFSALRTADRADLARQIGDLSTTVTEVARALGDISRRMAEAQDRLQAVERRSSVIEAAAAEAARKLVQPVSAELVVLTSLVKDLAETAASHEQSLAAHGQSLQGLAARPPVIMAPARPAAPGELAAPLAAPPLKPTPVVRHGLLAGLSETDARALLERAVRAGRVEIYLQPVVTLPQRKVRYYAVMPRLRADDGALLTPGDYLDLARAARLEPEIDLQALLRAVQVIRKLITRNREIGLLLDLATDTLGDTDAMARYAEFLDANRALGPALVFQVGQEQLRTLGPVEAEMLAGIVERGFRLALTGVHDLRFDARDLAERGVRFVKIPAAGLLDRSREAVSEIHPADLADLFGRHGIDLIGEGIESEGQVVDLIDYDVKFGQGDLFAPPKPVRADALDRRPPPRDAVRDLARDLAEPLPRPAEGKPAAPPRRGGLADLAKTIRRV